MTEMAGIVKKKPVDTSSSSTGQSNNPKHLVAPRQRGIPTRVCKDGDRQLDGNRNLRPTSRVQLSSSESLENKDHNSNPKLDNADAKTGSASLRSLSSLSSPMTSARKTKLIADCDNRSQVISSGSTSVSDQDGEKPVNRVRASRLSTYNPAKLRPVAKSNIEQSSPVPTTQVAESNHNLFKSPKRFAGNKNCYSKNKNKVSSSDETCALKSTEELLCLNGASGKEISVSADHIAVRDEHRNATAAGLLNANEVFVSDSSVISEPAVTGSCLKEISPEKANERSLERAAETKRFARGRPGTENLGNRSNLRPQSSGGLTTTLRKNQKLRQSTSTERTATSIPRNTNSQPASESGAVNSSEMEQESSKRWKGSGGSGTKVSALKETSGKVDVSNGPKFHSVARNQNAAVAVVAGSKPDKGLKNHVNMTVSGLYRNAHVPSRKAEVRGRETSAKLSLVPKILVSREPQDLESVPLSNLKASSDVQQKNEVIVHKSSPVSCSMAEVPSVNNNMHPSDNRQCQQPMVQTMNGGDTNEDSNRRLFRSRHSRAADAADDDGHPKLGRYVEMDDVQSTDSWNPHRVDADGKRPASESENVVVMDVETFEQMKDEFEALKATVLQLQRVLIEDDAVESQTGDNSWQSAVKSHCYDGGDEATPTDGQIQLANVCQVLQENIRLQGKVDELEKLLQEQERLISILRHKSAPFHIRMLPGIESATSETDVQSQLRNSCCATEHNVEVPVSSLSSRLTRSADEPTQSNLHLSTTSASPPGSPQRTRFLHTTTVHHFAEKSEKCHSPTSSKAFGSNDCEMQCNDAGESPCSHDHNKPVVHSLQDDGRDVTSTDFADSSQMVETSPSKRLRRATLGGCEEEEFSGEYSMFDYNFSVDSDSELGSGICDAPESIYLGVTDAGKGGMIPFVGVEHCIPDRRLMNEENGIHGFMATSDSRLGRGDVAITKADASDNYDVPSSAQTDQNFNGCLTENGICDRLGKFDESLSSNSLVSPVRAEEARTVYKVLDSVESSSQRICEETDESSVFNSPVRFERRAAELWARYDEMPEKALIKPHPKCETSSIPSVPCNSVSVEIDSLKPVKTSQSSNVTQSSKIPNQSRTLLRIPKCNVGTMNHEVDEFTSGSSVASPPPSGVCSISQPVHVVPEVANPNQRQLKEPASSSSRLPSLRLPRVSKLPTSVAK